MNSQITNAGQADIQCPVRNGRKGTPLLLVFGLGCALCAVSLLPQIALIAAPKESELAALERDQSHQLFSVDRVLHGAIPYKDFFWNYGLTPLYGYGMFCKILGGASIRAIQWQNAIWCVVTAGLSLVVMARAGGMLCGLAVWLLTQFAWPFGLDAVGYPCYERVTLLGIALLWRAPSQRPRWHPLLTGLLLGFLQSIKFGSALVAGLSWLVLDALWMAGSGAGAVALRKWVVELAQILLGFLLVEGVIVAHAVATLGPALAYDTLLPLYFYQWYGSYVGKTSPRWPGYINVGLLVGYQIPIILAFAGVWVTSGLIVQRRRSYNAEHRPWVGETSPAAFLGLFYVIGLIVFFKHAALIFAYRYLLAPALAVLLRAYPQPVVRTLLCVALLPSGALLPLKMWRDAQAARREPTADLQSFQMPNGQALLLERATGRAVLATMARLRQMQSDPSHSGRKGFLILSMGSGFHFYGELDLACRHSSFFPGVIRGFESERVLDQVLNAHAVVLQLSHDRPGLISPADPKRLAASEWNPFSEPALRKRFAACLSTPEIYPDGWVIFPVAGARNKELEWAPSELPACIPR